MTDATIVGHGTDNGSGADDALFLKLFSGEVLTAFNVKNMMSALHRVRTIPNGKSAQFPVLHKVSGNYHTPGTELTGQAVNTAERVIVIDDMLVADVFVPEIDELKAHYDVRAPYTKQIGEELARIWDVHTLQLVCLAARAASVISGDSLGGGTTDINAGYATTGATIADGIFEGMQVLDEKNIDEDARYAALRPAEYYLLAKTTEVLNRDWGGSGVYSEGTVLKVAGCHIVKTNNLPSTNVTSGPSQYRGDFSNTEIAIWNEQAVGTVKLRDPATVIAPDPRRLGTLIYGKMALGSDYLRPQCAWEGTSA